MKRAPVAAASLAIVAAIVAVAVRWGGGGGGADDAAPTSSRRSPAASVKPPDAESAPKPETPDAVVTPDRAPAAKSAATATADASSLTLDLRGPDDEPLAAGTIFMESDPKSGVLSEVAPGRFASKPSSASRCEWTRAAPTVSLLDSIRFLRAEASSGIDELRCRDLASGSIEVDPSAKRAATDVLVVRLAGRPGIYGRIQDVPDAPSTRVVWIERAALDGAVHPSDEIARRGHAVMPHRRGGQAELYEVFGLEPGAYFVGLQDEMGDVIEPLTSVAVVDRMVRADLAAHYDEASALTVRVVGLSDEDAAHAEFAWIDGAAPSDGWSSLRREVVDATTFRVTPVGGAARDTMRRLLAGQLAPGEKCAIALMRQSEVVVAQPLADGQHEVTLEVGADARLTVRMRVGPEPIRLRLEVVPAAAVALLFQPPAASGPDLQDGKTATRTFEHLAPGDFVLQIWRPLASSLHHGEVWWPILRRTATLHAGDQELAVDPPMLHPLTIRFDRARFGADAKVQLLLRGYEKWPRYAQPDDHGLARFDEVPAGDYKVSVIGDESGQADCTIPGTSELTIAPTRRDK